MTPVVVKIGGSLAGSERLKLVLDIVARSAYPAVVVPGGGPFADAVRHEQGRIGYTDRAAHIMAILAMHQMAVAMTSLQPKLLRAETPADIHAVLRYGRVPVWLPLSISINDSEIPQDWSITADGLAARLAERLGGAPVALVKSRRVEPDASVEVLVASGLVDRAFATISSRAGIAWRVFGPGEEFALAAALNEGPLRLTFAD